MSKRRSREVSRSGIEDLSPNESPRKESPGRRMPALKMVAESRSPELNEAELKQLISNRYAVGEVLYEVEDKEWCRLVALEYVPDSGALKGRACLRYHSQEGSGRNRTIDYKELLAVATYFRDHGTFPDNMKKLLRLSCASGGKCIAVTRSVLSKVFEVNGSRSRGPRSLQRP